MTCFYESITEYFECFQYFNLEINDLKNKNLFQKARVPFCSWKDLDWKCTISILRQIDWGAWNGPITKHRGWSVSTLSFLKILFQFKSLINRESRFIVPTTQVSILPFFKGVGVLFEKAFSLWVSVRIRNYWHSFLMSWVLHLNREIIQCKKNP